MATADLGTWKGEPAVTLRADDYAATFLPACGMLVTSLQYRGEEYVAWPRSLADFRGGSMTAIPLVHPWGNRLAAWEYRVGRKRVDLRGLEISDDGKGLPIHGNLRAAPFDIVRLEPGRLHARFDYAAHPDKLAAFPFPHTVAVDARLDGRGLRLTTVVVPTGRAAVPISFCWHPYLQLPSGRRVEWILRWPACEHVEVDEHIIPTGVRTPQAASRAPIARRTYDDHYALGRDRHFSVEAEGRALHLRFDGDYPFGQLYVPPRREFIAIEPMTATIDALGAGTTPMCAPGETFRRDVLDRLRFVTAPRLLPPGAFTGFFGDLCVPDDLYWISRAPTAIVGMSYPGRADWVRLHDAGIGHVVCLSHTEIPYDATPCTARAYRLQDLVSGGPPRDVEAEERIVDAAATDVVDHVRRGIGVAVHCMGGRGRTGTVLGVALVRLGHPPDTVVDYLHRVAVARGRRGWPESDWQAGVVRAAQLRA